MSNDLPLSPAPASFRRSAVRWMIAATASFLVIMAAWWAATVMQRAAPEHAASARLTATDLFQFTNVFTVHLSFTTDQWNALEPRGGSGPFGGPGSRPFNGPPGHPPGTGGPPSGESPGRPDPFGPPGFSPSMFVTPLFLQADADHDGKLSAEEFLGLGRKWFGAWDTNESGSLDLAKLRAGINTAMPPPQDVMHFGPGRGQPMPGGPQAPGGPGRPGGNNMLLGAEGRRNGLASAMGIEFPTAQADLEFAGVPFPAVSVRYKGNGTFMGSRDSLKKSMKIDVNDHRPGRRIGGASKFNLHSSVTDPSWMNEVLSHKLFRDAGVPAPRSAYARLHLSVPGKFDRQYVSLCSLVENVDNSFARDRFGTTKGALFKPVTRQLFEDLGDDWSLYRQIYDPKTPVSDEEIQRVLSCCKLVSHASDAEFAAKLGDFLDLDAFARFMAVTTWLSTMDSILGVGQNYYLYLHPKTRRFQFIPWDLDHSFGQFAMVGTQEQRENLSIHKPWDNDIRFLDRVFKVPAFKQLYLARLREFNRSIFQPARIHAQVDLLASVLRPAIQDESPDMLARFDQVMSRSTDEPAPTFTFAPPGGGFGPPGGFGQPAKPIKPFVSARAQSVADQLDGESEGMLATRGGPFGGPGGPGGPATPLPGALLGPRGPGGPGAPLPAAPTGPGGTGGPGVPLPGRFFRISKYISLHLFTPISAFSLSALRS